MKFDDLDDMEVITSDLQERLSSWRRLPGVVERSPQSVGEASFNEAHVRQRERRAASMCETLVKEHDAFITALRALVENGGERDAISKSELRIWLRLFWGFLSNSAPKTSIKDSGMNWKTCPKRLSKPSPSPHHSRPGRGFSES